MQTELSFFRTTAKLTNNLVALTYNNANRIAHLVLHQKTNRTNKVLFLNDMFTESGKCLFRKNDQLWMFLVDL